MQPAHCYVLGRHAAWVRGFNRNCIIATAIRNILDQHLGWVSANDIESTCQHKTNELHSVLEHILFRFCLTYVCARVWVDPISVVVVLHRLAHNLDVVDVNVR